MEVGVEQERLQQEAEVDVKVNEEEVTTQTFGPIFFTWFSGKGSRQLTLWLRLPLTRKLVDALLLQFCRRG